MADGDYERRGAREAELKRFSKIISEQRKVPNYDIILRNTSNEVAKPSSKALS